MANNSQDLNELLRSLTAYRSLNTQPITPNPEQEPFGQHIYGQQRFANETSIDEPQHRIQQQQPANGTSVNDYQSYMQQQSQLRNGSAYLHSQNTAFNPIVLPSTITQQELTSNPNCTTFGHQYNQFPIPINAYHQYTPSSQNMSVNNSHDSTTLPLDMNSSQFIETLQPQISQATPIVRPPSKTDQAAGKAIQEPIPPVPNARTIPTGPDSRDITEWPIALRHVTRLAATNQDLGRSIRKLIANQDENEGQWWAGREALVERQAARAESQRKLDEVMRVVGSQMPTGTTETDDAAELLTYDKKVHGAMMKMEAAISKDLQALGIPFFETRPALIKDYVAATGSNTEEDVSESSGKQRTNNSSSDVNGDRTSSNQKRITKAELKVLKRRMIQHLEDLYKE